MNKTSVSMLVAASIAVMPLPAPAQEISAPPIYVRPVNLPNNEQVKDLVHENLSLASAVAAQRQSISEKVDGQTQIFTDAEQFERLRQLLQTYSDQIDERDHLLKIKDRILADRDKQIGDLRMTIARIKDTAVSSALDQHEPVKAQVAQAQPNAGFDARKYAVLEQQFQQISGLKEELFKTKQQLIEANRKYAQALSDYQVKVQEAQAQHKAPTEAVQQLKTDAGAASAQLQEQLKVQNEKLARMERLATQQNKQIEDLKQQVFSQNGQIQDLTKQLRQAKAAQGASINAGPIVVTGKGQPAPATDKSQALAAQQNKQIEDLKQQIASQNAQIEDLKQQLQQAKAAQNAPAANPPDAYQLQKIADLGQQLNQSQQEVAQLKIELAKDDNAFAKIRINGLALRKTLGRQRAELKTKDEFIAEFKNQLAQARTQLDEQAAKVQQIQQEITTKNADLAAAGARMRLWEQLAAKHREHIALLEQKGRLLAQAGVSVQDKEKMRELQASIDALQQQVAALRKEVADRTNERNQVYGLLDEYKKELQRRASITEDDLKQASSYSSQRDQLEQSLRRAENDLQSKQMEIESLHGQIDQLKQSAQQAQEDSQAKDLSLTMVQSKLDEAVKGNRSAQLQDELNQTNQELSQEKEKLSVAEAKLREASQSGELAKVQEMLKSSREEIVQLNSLLQQKEDKIAQLMKNPQKAQQTPYREDYPQLRQTVRDAKEQIATLKEKLRQKHQAAFSMDPLYTQMDNQIKALKEELINMIKDNARLKHRLDDLSMQLQETQSALTESQKQAPPASSNPQP